MPSNSYNAPSPARVNDTFARWMSPAITGRAMLSSMTKVHLLFEIVKLPLSQMAPWENRSCDICGKKVSMTFAPQDIVLEMDRRFSRHWDFLATCTTKSRMIRFAQRVTSEVAGVGNVATSSTVHDGGFFSPNFCSFVTV